METIKLYEPAEGRWLEVPVDFVHDNDADAAPQDLSGRNKDLKSDPTGA